MFFRYYGRNRAKIYFWCTMTTMVVFRWWILMLLLHRSTSKLVTYTYDSFTDHNKALKVPFLFVCRGKILFLWFVFFCWGFDVGARCPCINSIRINQNVWMDPTEWSAPLHLMTRILKAIKILKLQLKNLQKQPNGNGVLLSDWKQLNKYPLMVEVKPLKNSVV